MENIFMIVGTILALVCLCFMVVMMCCFMINVIADTIYEIKQRKKRGK